MESEWETVVEVVIFRVGVKQRSPSYEVKVKVDDCDVRMEVDTGSSVSLVSQATYERLWLKRGLSPCKYRLRLYLEESITVLGCMQVNVIYKTQAVQLPLLVVEGSGPSLLGRNWLEHIVLDWQDIRHLSCTPLQAVLDKQQSAFQDSWGP